MMDLKDKKGLIVGIANDQSIAYGCAKKLKEAGASLAVTYLNDKAKKFVAPLADTLEAEIFMPLDVQNPSEIAQLFEEIETQWGKLDFLVHSIAYAPLHDLHGRLVDCSLEGFLLAMDISCHSFLRLAQYAEPLMADGGSLLTLTYYGADKVVSHYDVMGPVKAALESSVRYLAYELGPKNIRVNALSPGPISTRAANGLHQFNHLLEEAVRVSPQHRLVTIDDVGNLATFLTSDASQSITGDIFYVDAGYHIMGMA